MNSSREILRSASGIVATLLAILIAIVVLGLHVERSIQKDPSAYSVSVPWKGAPPRSARPAGYRAGS
jgi:hypothetical protein